MSELLATQLEKLLPTIFNFCARMTLSTEDAQKATYETFARAFGGQPPESADELELWLLKIAAHVSEKRLPAEAEVDFDLLDDTLRSEATRNTQIASLTSPEREFLLWELKQGCMTAVINCLSPGERIAFVLSNVIGKSDEEAARTLGIKVSAYKVRMSRASQKIGDYLAPRCEHIDPRNPCHCPSRIGNALDKGFIAPPRGEVQLRTPNRPFAGEIKSPDASKIFRTLPPIEVPAELLARLRRAAASGQWAKERG